MTITASSILGEKVINTKGEKLGNIKDLMIDMTTGRVSYAVLSFGGFLGMVEKLFAVPLESFSTDPDGGEFVLDFSEENLENTEEFDKDNWPAHPQPEFCRLRRLKAELETGQVSVSRNGRSGSYRQLTNRVSQRQDFQ